MVFTMSCEDFVKILLFYWDEQTKQIFKVLKCFLILHPHGLESETFGFVFQCPMTKPLFPNLNGENINGGR